MALFICGTDTGVGKTYSAATLMLRYRRIENLRYWKPVQTGFPPDDDRATVMRICNNRISDTCFYPTAETYRESLSPHRAAELEDTVVNYNHLCDLCLEYKKSSPLLIEAAGGLLVPITREKSWLDFLVRTGVSPLIVARTGLGTINHSLLTIKALRSAGVEPVGILFCGLQNEDNVRTICETGKIAFIGSWNLESWQTSPDMLSFIDQMIDPDGKLEAFL